MTEDFDVERDFSDCQIKRADHVVKGDVVCFKLKSADYSVTGIRYTHIGMVRHSHSAGSNSYWPDELLYVRKLDALSEYYRDRLNSGLASLAQ